MGKWIELPDSTVIDLNRPLVVSTPARPIGLKDTTSVELEGPPELETRSRDSDTASWLGRRIRFLLVSGDGLITLLVSYGLVRNPGWAVACGFAVVVLFAQCGLYRSRLRWSLLDDVPALAGRTIVSVALVGFAGVASGISMTAATGALVGGLLIAALLVVKECAYIWLRSERRAGKAQCATLIVGGGLIARELATVLRSHPELGLRPVAYVDSEPARAESTMPIPYEGTVDKTSDTVVRRDINVILIAYGPNKDSHLAEAIRRGPASSCAVYMVPRLFEIAKAEGESEHIGAITVVKLKRGPDRGPAIAIKRSFDIGFGSLVLLAALPIMVVCAIAVRTTGPGIIFSQERIGKNSRPFRMYKFRSMRPSNPLQSQTSWAAREDPRLTRVGKYLRRTSLDELPQLVNVVRGDMTLVGPRPERPYFVEQFTREFPHYTHRHRARTGLTGMAQVNGLRGEDTHIGLRARYDNYYIENWSLWFDVKVVLLTVKEVLRASGG